MYVLSQREWISSEAGDSVAGNQFVVCEAH